MISPSNLESHVPIRYDLKIETEKPTVDALLLDGWEPFAGTSIPAALVGILDRTVIHIVYLRREQVNPRLDMARFGPGVDTCGATLGALLDELDGQDAEDERRDADVAACNAAWQDGSKCKRPANHDGAHTVISRGGRPVEWL